MNKLEHGWYKERALGETCINFMYRLKGLDSEEYCCYRNHVTNARELSVEINFSYTTDILLNCWFRLPARGQSDTVTTNT